MNSLTYLSELVSSSNNTAEPDSRGSWFASQISWSRFYLVFLIPLGLRLGESYKSRRRTEKIEETDCTFRRWRQMEMKDECCARLPLPLYPYARRVASNAWHRVCRSLSVMEEKNPFRTGNRTPVLLFRTSSRMNYRLILTSPCVVNNPESYSGGPGLKYRSADRLSGMSFFLTFSQSLWVGICRDNTLNEGHDHFLPHLFQFIIHLSSSGRWIISTRSTHLTTTTSLLQRNYMAQYPRRL
jgi:hypothetical protein